MNTDNLILRQTDNAPLINKEDTLTSAEFDANIIKIYNDLLANNYVSDSTLTFSSVRSYVTGEYATYNGRLWVATTESTGVSPTIDSFEWNDVFPSVLAHEKNKDTILDEGGTNETTVAEIRAFINAGLTSTTNLSLTTKTPYSFKIESSTGEAVTLPEANFEEAGLLNATDKVKIDNLSGINTGDQTLESLNAEDVSNKVTNFTTINNTLYPTTQAVDTYLTAQVPPLVETFIGGLVAQDLQSVTTVGNTTNDNIQFNEGAGILFDNTSKLKKGTIDAGYGGANGIAQICSVGYELKWEAGRLYVMGDGGTTIREVSHNFTTTPSATDDNTKGFIVGSRWILDNGDLYICTDNTTATAVWVLQTIDSVPTDGSTKAVSSNGVFDALDTKVDKVAGSRLITSAESTLLGNTSGTNTGDQTISDATISLTDITTNNVSSTKHGFAPKTPNNTTTFLRGDGTWATPSAGGLTYFTEAQNTASPNATVNVDSLTAVASTTNADMALLPKGTGAFIVGHIPDGATGGLKRGAGAIELQSGAMYYDGATGANSVVIGKGSGATATGSIAIGTNCNASGNYSLALGGVATGLYSVSIGGVLSSGQSSVAMSGATASGTNSFAFGTATASGVGSFAIGGEAGGTANASSAYCTAIGSATTASGRYSMAILSNSNTFTHGSRFSYGSYNSSANNPLGSIQGSTLVTGVDTTGNTPTTPICYGGNAIPLILQNNNSIRFKGTIIGRQSGSTNTSAWDIDGIIQRGTSAATTTLLIGNVNVVQNTPAWGTPTLTADTTNGGLDIKVIGAATTNIRWTCVLNTTEVIYA